MFKPNEIPEDHQVRCWLGWNPQFGFEKLMCSHLLCHIFTMMSILSICYIIMDKAIGLVSSIILVGPFSYWVTLLHCWMWEQMAIASLRYFREIPGVALNKWLCHLTNELRECVRSWKLLYVTWMVSSHVCGTFDTNMVFHPKLAKWAWFIHIFGFYF